MLEHQSPDNVTEVSCTTTTLVKFHSGLKKRSKNHCMKKSTNGVNGSPNGSHCAIANGGHPNPSSSTSGAYGRPPFVTTVCRGKFLPSKFDLMVERSLFTFSSRPRPIGLVTRHQCSLSGGPLKDCDHTPRGAHDYFNLMWDPHIYRGKATTTTTPLRTKIGENENENKVGDGNLSSGDIKYRKKRTSYYTSSTNNGMNKSRYKITTRVTTKTKGLNKMSPNEERQHTHVQTDQFLEDLSGDMEIDENDAIVQTDPIHDFPTRHKRDNDRYITTKNGVDAFTQVLPGELYSFDEEVQPIVEALVGKILQQSLLETMEEEELAALREQQQRFYEKRREEEKLLRELQEHHERITQEKERLKLQIQGVSSANTLNLEDQEMIEQAIRSQSANNLSIPTSYLIELLPSVLNSLRQEGFFSDNTGDDIFSTFAPRYRSSSKAESDVGEPITVESSGSLSVDPDEVIKLNVTSEQQGDNEDEGDGVEIIEHETDDAGVSEQDQESTTLFDDSNDHDQPNINDVESTNKLPNGRLPSFERIEGAAIEAEVK